MKQFDSIFFDENFCTVIKSTNASPLPLPLADDTENNLASIAEAGSQSSVDIDNTNHAVLNGYIYNSRRWVTSLESFQDLTGTLSVVQLVQEIHFRIFCARTHH